MNLFENMEPVDPFEPLAVRMRPRSLDHFFGQEQVVGPGTFLRSMIEEDKVPSLLLYGPSGTLLKKRCVFAVPCNNGQFYF